MSFCPRPSVGQSVCFSASGHRYFFHATHQSRRCKMMFDKHFLRRHLILAVWPQAHGATLVHFKARKLHIEIFSTYFILACRPNSLGISVYISVSACECVCVVSMVTVGGRCIREYKTVILSVHSRAINSMITHQSGCCVWLHNHRSKSHSHSAPSYQGGYCFNPLLRGSERGCVEPICQAGWCKCTGALNTGR